MSSSVFSSQWDGFSSFTKEANDKQNPIYLTMAGDCYLQCEVLCTQNESETILFFTNRFAPPVANRCTNKTFIYLDHSSKGPPLYDVASKEKRDDLIVGNYLSQSRGEVLFRFPRGMFIGQQSPGTIISTPQTTYADLNSNRVIEPNEPNGNFILAYRRNGYRNDVLQFTNPSFITNDLWDKKNNKEFATTLLLPNEQLYVVNLDSPFPILLALQSYMYAEGFLKLFPFRYIVVISFVNLGIVFGILLLTVFLKKTIGKLFQGKKLRPQPNLFYDTYTEICANAVGNKYFFRWLIGMELQSLQKVLMSHYSNMDYISRPQFVDELKSKYEALSSIDLKTILFYVTNTELDIEVSSVATAKKLSSTINYVTTTLKRGV